MSRPDARAPGEHRDPVASVPLDGPRPTAGPIAILPTENSAHAAAIRAGGGSVGPLDANTRGLIWLNLDAAALATTLSEHPGIEWVQLPMAGVDAFADVFATYRDSPLPLFTSAKGAFSEPVAEHALALTLATLRGLPEKSRSRSWADPKTGTSLYGRRVVIVGAGGIAVELLRLLAPFEVDVTVVRRTDDPLPGADRTVAVADFDSVLPDADVVIIAAAATDETARLIDARRLALLRPEAVLVNIARGSLVDQEALVDALNSGRLAGAGLDVTTPEPLPDGHPLWNAPRCVITSHSADTPEMVEPLLAERVRRNVVALTTGGEFVGRVDPARGY